MNERWLLHKGELLKRGEGEEEEGELGGNKQLKSGKLRELNLRLFELFLADSLMKNLASERGMFLKAASSRIRF